MVNILIIGDGTQATTTLYERWSEDSVLSGIVCVLAPEVSDNLELGGRILGEFSAVVLIPANVTPGLSDQLQAALTEYVSNGGLLICLPFTAWSAAFHRSPELDALLPVEASGFQEGLSIQIDDASSRLLSRQPPHYFVVAPPLTAISQGGHLLSAETLEPRPGSEVLSEFVVDGDRRFPLAILRYVHRGAVLYFNACHHPEQGPECIWSVEDGTGGVESLGLATLLFSYGLAVWRGLDRTVSTLPDFIVKLGASIDELSSYDRDMGPDAEFVEAIWAHYGSESDADTLLFPDIAEYRALSRVSRLMLCRALWVLTEMLWQPQYDAADVAAALQGYRSPKGGAILDLLQPTPENKRRLLESLAVFVLLLVDGVDVVGQNVRTATGELDAVFTASTRAREELWPELPGTFAVECKNWHDPVGAPVIRDFRGKLDDLRLKMGILFCRSGITGNRTRDAKALLRDYRRDGVLVLIVTADDLRKALRSLSPASALQAARRDTLLL